MNDGEKQALAEADKVAGQYREVSMKDKDGSYIWACGIPLYICMYNSEMLNACSISLGKAMRCSEHICTITNSVTIHVMHYYFFYTIYTTASSMHKRWSKYSDIHILYDFAKSRLDLKYKVWQALT